MKKNIKVLEIIDSHGWCGTKEQTYLITRELSKFFYVDLALAYDHKEMIERLQNKVPLKFFEIDNGSKRRFNVKNYFRLYKIINNGNYDVVIANSSWSFNYLRVVIPFLKKRPKIVAMRRSGYIPSFFSKYLKYSVADKIVVVSKKVAEELKSKDFFPEKLEIIESGIDLERFYPEKYDSLEVRKELGLLPEDKVFINVANWQPWRKGQDILLRAFKNLKCNNCKLILVGNDTDGTEAHEMISDLGLEDKVKTLGFRYDVDKIIHGADFFVLSSYSEGIAGALLQAMASGKVVISTLAGGIGEYLKDGYNGFTVKVGDQKELEEKMRKALNISEEEYNLISSRAVNTAKKYSIEETTKKWVNLINNLVNS